MIAGLVLPSLVAEWLQLLLRWAHVIAGILWIGDSFLFMWMDASLEPPSRPRAGAVAGELWMVHSGGFYEVVKRRFLAPDEMPNTLHWFKWQAYTTWLTGLALLAVVFWLGGAGFLEDPGTSALGHGAAVALSAGALVGAWLLYDALWMSPLAHSPRAAAIVSFALLGGAIAGLSATLSGRGAYLTIGALLGTIMAANVWRRIIPAQTQMLAATRAGTAVDVSLGARAKQRSIHNHYLTLPVVFCMLSGHFPSTYGHPWRGLVLALFVVFGIAVKYWMNHRGRTPLAILAAGILSLVALVALTARPAARAPAAAAPALGEIPFSTVRAIVGRRCTTCHSAHPTNPSFPQAPAGVQLDDPARLRALVERIRVRAVETKTMPLGNMTGMTDAERDTLAAWIAAGARAR